MNTIDNSVALMNSTYSPKNTKIDTSNDIKLKEQTDKFEAFFIKKILDLSIKNESELYPKDPGEKIYNSMYNDAVSNEMSGSLGFSALLFDFLKENR